MGFISKKRAKNVIPSNNETIEREFASEIVEIFEEKLEELHIQKYHEKKSWKEKQQKQKQPFNLV